MSDLCFPFNKTECKKYISMQYFSEYSHHKEILSPFFTQENFQSKNNFFDLVHAHFLISIAKKIQVKKYVFDTVKKDENKVENFLY